MKSAQLTEIKERKRSVTFTSSSVSNSWSHSDYCPLITISCACRLPG